MHKIAWKGYSLSRLMLGTAQLGMEYGIANRRGRLSYKAVRDILAGALEGGVNCLDTAALYGDSEELIGRALADLGAADSVMVASKLPHVPAGRKSQRAIKSWMREAVAGSLKRLRIGCLPVCLFHKESDSRYLDILHEIKDEGLIRFAGVSCSAQPAEALELVRSADALQVPANILDPRHVRSGVLKEARVRGAAVFVRSVYLQGLIPMPERDIPDALKAVIPQRRRLGAIAGDAGIGLPELALRYVLSLDGATCVIT